MSTQTRLAIEVRAIGFRILTFVVFVLPIVLAACTEGDGGGGGGGPGY